MRRKSSRSWWENVKTSPRERANKSVVVIGIDVGLSGAMAVVRFGLLALADIPVSVKPGASLIRRQVDPVALAELIRANVPDYTEAVAVIEQLYGMRRGRDSAPQGAASIFSLGDSNGVIRGVLGALGVRVETVNPNVWKRRFGLLRTRKEESIALARRLYPDASLERAKDHNRAEALLIAKWGEERFAGGPYTMPVW